MTLKLRLRVQVFARGSLLSRPPPARLSHCSSSVRKITSLRLSLESIFSFLPLNAPRKRHSAMLFSALSLDSQLTRRNTISIYVPMIVSQTGSCVHWRFTSGSLPSFPLCLGWSVRRFACLLTRSHYPTFLFVVQFMFRKIWCCYSAIYLAPWDGPENVVSYLSSKFETNRYLIPPLVLSSLLQVL